MTVQIDTTAENNGVRLIVQGSHPSNPSAGHVLLYYVTGTASPGLFIEDSSGNKYGPYITGSSSGSGLPDAHGCKLTRTSGNVNVGNNTFTAIPFTSEDYDTDNMHDNSTNNTRITIPSIAGVTTGLWRFVAFGYTDVTSGRADCEFRVGGSTIIGITLLPASASLGGAYIAVTEAVLSAGNYVENLVRTSGGNGNVVFDSTPASPFFMASFIGKVT